MASKSRGGLSKKEFSRSQAAKATVKKKSVSSSSSSRPKDLVGAGPLLPGQKRAQAQPVANLYDRFFPEVSNQASGKAKNKKSSKSNNVDFLSENRKIASGAKKNYAIDQSTGLSYSLNDTISAPDERVASRLKSGFMRAGDKAIEFGGNLAKPLIQIADKYHMPELNISGNAGDYLREKVFGINTAQASYDEDQPETALSHYLNKPIEEDVPTSSEGGALYYNNYNPWGEKFKREILALNTQPKGIPDASPLLPGQKTDTANMDMYSKSNDYNYTNGIPFDTGVPFDTSGVADTNTPQINPLLDENDVQRTNATTTRKYGAGAFGNGRLLQGTGKDPYTKSYKSSLKDFSRQEKDVSKQFEDLIKGLDSQYQQAQTEATNALNTELQNNLTHLASVMNANNTGDSEQRAQMMAVQQRDANTALSQLLAKLNIQKAQDISDYKTKASNAINEIRQRRQALQERYDQQRLEMQMKKEEDAYKYNLALSKTGNKTGKKTVKKPTLPYGQPVAEGGNYYQYFNDGTRTNLSTGEREYQE